MRDYFCPVPKKGLKPKKPPKPIARRTPLKPGKPPKRCKSSFKAWDNGKRSRQKSDADVLAWAVEKQAEALQKLSPEHRKIADFLTANRIRIELEKIWLNGDRHIRSDIYLPDHKLSIEVDDPSHRGQERHDKDRGMWLACNHGVGTMRLPHAEIRSGKAELRLAQALAIN